MHTALTPTLHFDNAEYAGRRARLDAAMQAHSLDAILLFAPESQYWLTGHDTFGFCFFQCVIYANGQTHLLARSADLRQAQLTSNITDIRIWTDGVDAPADVLAAWVTELGLTGRIGVELDTHGLTAAAWNDLREVLPDLVDSSATVSQLRLLKSPAELDYLRTAGQITDAALEAALPLIIAGGDEGAILAAMQGEVFAQGGDYPANPFVIGSGTNALLCRYRSGRRVLDATDQMTLEWAGVWRQYHAAAMRSVIVGDPSTIQVKMHAAAEEALMACEAALIPDQPMSNVYHEHVRVLDAHGLSAHRLNACGYSQGARYAPSWMEHQMFHAGADTIMAPGMTFFLHMILMDSDSGAAISLGRTSIITPTGTECLSTKPLGMIVQ